MARASHQWVPWGDHAGFSATLMGPLGHREKTMLNMIYGVLVMVPITFAIAGYALVSRG